MKGTFIREVPSWDDAPVPICHGGDLGALTFCCHPTTPHLPPHLPEGLRELVEREVGGIQKKGRRDPPS